VWLCEQGFHKSQLKGFFYIGNKFNENMINSVLLAEDCVSKSVC